MGGGGVNLRLRTQTEEGDLECVVLRTREEGQIFEISAYVLWMAPRQSGKYCSMLILNSASIPFYSSNTRC